MLNSKSITFLKALFVLWLALDDQKELQFVIGNHISEPKRQMKSALLITGILRGLNDTLPTILRVFGQNDVDIYFAGGFKDSGAVAEFEGLNSLLRNPLLKNYKIDNISSLTDSLFPFVPSYPYHQKWTSSNRMQVNNIISLHRWKQGLDMILESGVYYSWIAKVRTDSFFSMRTDPINFQNLEQLINGGDIPAQIFHITPQPRRIIHSLAISLNEQNHCNLKSSVCYKLFLPPFSNHFGGFNDREAIGPLNTMIHYLYSIFKVDFVVVNNKLDFHPESLLRATITTSLQDTLVATSPPTYLAIYYLVPWVVCICRKSPCYEVEDTHADNFGMSIHVGMQCYEGTYSQSAPSTEYLDETIP